MKIWMSNLGYLRGIDGSLRQHLLRAHRHLYHPVSAQARILSEVSALLAQEAPDLCCFVEIERGSLNTGRVNQIEQLAGKAYPFYDIENKYGPESRLRHAPVWRGKSNGFMSKKPLAFGRLYFRHGAKRLVYQITLPDGTLLFFAHCSLKKNVRARQLEEIAMLLESAPSPAIFLGDFNILHGLGELQPLLRSGRIRLLNEPHIPTFRFHRTSQTLDLAVATEDVAHRLKLRILPQPFSDHAALVLEMD
jgi:endonuclease/exonuclease/phosphatase family metal-dependent hydrolase